MRYFSLIILSLALVMGLAFSCKKWSDPAPIEDSRLTRLYCNDPSAVNYNWDFPGKPDNSVCFYPADLFAGTYMYYDTLAVSQSDLYFAADSYLLNISKISQTKVSIQGFCPNNNLILTAGATYSATLDTLVGDSLTAHPGQFFCRTVDTIVGTFTRDKVDSALIYVNLIVRSDTGSTTHTGRARKR